MEWMILPLKRYFDFKGRSRRKEFWMWVLFTIIVTIILSVLDVMLGFGGEMSSDTSVPGDGSSALGAAGALSGGVLASIFALATLIPNLSVSVRRLHDIDRTGWWIILPVGFYLVGFGLMIGGGLSGSGGTMTAAMVLVGIGLLTAILLLVWYCMSGTAGPNRFGEDPKGQATNAEDVFG